MHGQGVVAQMIELMMHCLFGAFPGRKRSGSIPRCSSPREGSTQRMMRPDDCVSSVASTSKLQSRVRLNSSARSLVHNGEAQMRCARGFNCPVRSSSIRSRPKLLEEAVAVAEEYWHR